MKKIVYILSVALAAAACSKPESPVTNPEPQEPVTGKVEFTAVFGEAPVVKSELSGESVLWKAGDEISILWDGGNTTAQADAAGAQANFSASVDDASEYFAVYPSKASVSLSGGALTVGIPAEQNGAFEDVNIAIAKTTERSLVFKNLCALGKITLSRNDIAKIEFKGGEGQNLAGDVTLSLDGEGVPSVISTASAAESIVLTPASGDAFAAGSYYFAAIPGTLEKVEFTLTTVSGNTILGKASANPAELLRSKALNFGTLDNIATADVLTLRFAFGPEKGAKAGYDPEGKWPTDWVANLNEGVSYTYAIDEVNYGFYVKDLVQSTSKNFKWDTNNKDGYADRISIPSATVYFGLPAIEDFKLTGVVVGQSRRGKTDNTETAVTQVGVTSHIPEAEGENNSYVSGGELQEWHGWPDGDDKSGKKAVVDHAFQLSGTQANTVYYLNSDNSEIGLYFSRLVLTYEKVSE